MPGAARSLEAGARTSWSSDGAGNWTAQVEGEPRSDLPPGVKARAKGQKLAVSLGERYEDGYAVAPGGNRAFGLRVHPLAGSGPVSIGPDGLRAPRTSSAASMRCTSSRPTAWKSCSSRATRR